MKRLVDWNFLVRQPDGAIRVVTFYAGTEAAALKLARAWAKRTGHEIEAVEKDVVGAA